MEKRKLDPAAHAGLAKSSFYQTDKWQIGRSDIKTFIVPKNTIPQHLEKAFVKTGDRGPVREEITYDQKKFELDEMTDIEGGRVVIVLRDAHTAVADVTFEENTFVVNMFEVPKSGIFSCSKEELAKAIHAAKWVLEMHVMPQFKNELVSDSDSDSQKR